jgi:hypothetical protein
MTTSSDMITCPNCGQRSPSWAATCKNCGSHLSLTQSDSSLKHKTVQQTVSPGAPPQKLPTIAHVVCGWPLILMFIGGAIGGALGGLAYVINLSIYKSKMPAALKFVLNPLVGILAIAVWYMIFTMLRK